MKKPLQFAIAQTIGVTVTMVIANQIRKGEPRWLQAALIGLASGVGVGLYVRWQLKKKESQTPDTAENSS